MGHEDKPHWPAEPDAQTVEQQYGEHAELYAEVRSKAAELVGRGSAAREWGEIEEKIEADKATGGDE